MNYTTTSPLSSAEGTSITSGQKLNLSAIPLFQFDVNYDSLKKLLDTIDNQISKCQVNIDTVKEEVNSRSKTEEVCGSLRSMTKAINIYDEKFLKVLNDSVNKEQFKFGKSRFDQETEPLCGKLQLIGNACTYLFSQLQKQEEKMARIETSLSLKADSKQIEEKIRQNKKKLTEKLDSDVKQLEDRLNACEKKSNESLGAFEALVKDVERRTIWKIQDCQDLLSKRVNEEFVNEAISSLEQSIQTQINNLSGGGPGSDKIDKFTQKIQTRMAEIEESLSEKMRLMKLSLKDIENAGKQRIAAEEKINDTTKAINEKLTQLQARMKLMEKEFDFRDAIEKSKNSFVEFDHRIKQLQTEFEKQQAAQLSMKELSGMENIFKRLDPHKLCSIEADLRVIEENVIRHEERIAALSSELKRKLDNMDFFGAMQKGVKDSSNNNPGLRSDDIRQIVADMLAKQQFSPNIDDEKMKKIGRDLSEMQVKIENVGEIERRVSRIFREIDINSVIKQIKLKANSEETKKEIFQVDYKGDRLSRGDLLNRSTLEYSIPVEASLQTEEKTVVNFSNIAIPTPRKFSNIAQSSNSQARSRPFSATTRKQK